jgi:hypothetical protein
LAWFSAGGDFLSTVLGVILSSATALAAVAALLTIFGIG